MSSRNAFLTSSQRLQATSISRALFAAQKVVGSVDVKLGAARVELAGEIETSYLVAMSNDLSRELESTEVEQEGRLLFAGTLGSTRLIDNMPLRMANPHE
jgi:pantoate--beta-alanine ligase